MGWQFASSRSFAAASTLVELLRLRALHCSPSTGYTFIGTGQQAEKHLSFQLLDRCARAIAVALVQMNAEGERVLLLYPPGLDFISAFFGCLYAGAIAVPAYPPRANRSAERLRAIIADAGASIALTSTSARPTIERACAAAGGAVDLRWLATDAIDNSLADAWVEPETGRSPIAFLQYTSGSTGSPKGVIVSHDNLLANQRMIQAGFGHDETTRFAGWLPLFHDMGLIGNVIQPLYLGVPCVLLSPADFLQQPVRWLEAISHYRATTSGGPNFAYDLCVRKVTPEQRSGLDLTSWRVAFNGAEPVRAETIERFAAAFAPRGFRREAFYPCYGMAEATLLVTGGAPRQPPVIQEFEAAALEVGRVRPCSEGDRARASKLVGCGAVLLDEQVVIVRPESCERCCAGEVGEIWVSGAHVASGYWERPDQSEATFGAYLADTGGGPFLRTGDLGFFEGDELFITGRLKDMIIVHGRNLYPQDIERTVEACCAALAAAGAAFGLENAEGVEGVVVVQEVERTALRNLAADAVFEAIRLAIAQEYEIPLLAIVLIKPGSIPKTSSGKIQRRACRARFLAQELDIVGEWHSPLPAQLPPVASSSGPGQESIVCWLSERLALKLGLVARAVDPDLPFVTYGLSSLDAVALTAELGDWLGRPVSAVLAWDYPSITQLAARLSLPAGQSDTPDPVSVLQSAVAVVGIGCRFPGADSPEDFWQLLIDGRDAVCTLPEARIADFGGPHPLPAGFLERVDGFDAQFFAMAPREAAATDPQQRLLLEVGWEALEDAGLSADVKGFLGGVFVGISSGDYARQSTEADAYFATGNAHSIAANRLSYLLDWSGPSLAVDTACSSSLVAVHLACRSLQRGECDVALAAGVNLILSDGLTQGFTRAGMLSPRGRCRTFDAGADGYARGEGCGAVVLKRLDDALTAGNRILAVVRGGATNQDGRSNGLTAPNGPAQQAVVRAALADAGVSAASLGYIEAHGTGTPLGDPIELQALATVLAGERAPCPVGSVKTNIGHLEAAAGIAGLIKVVLALHHGKIPPHLHLERPNPHFPLDGTALEVATIGRLWPTEQRFAGVSAFGFGGTNCHLVLAQAPLLEPGRGGALEILTVSARTRPALAALVGRYAAFLDHPDLDFVNFCRTACAGRSHFDCRLAFVAGGTTELRAQLNAASGLSAAALPVAAPKIGFLFTGQGSQYVGMGLQLYESEPVFRSALERCDVLLRPTLARPLLSVLYPEPGAASPLDETAYTQPALFALEYALLELWRSWGIEPAVVLGHSVGEYVAAYAAGVFSLEEGLRLVTERARLLDGLPAGGAMAAVFASELQVEAFIEPHRDRLAIAAVNGPAHVVLSGDGPTLEIVLDRLREQQIGVRPLRVLRAFHSPLVEPTLDAFERIAGEVAFELPKIPLVANLTGTLWPAGTGPDARYWRNHARGAVHFAAGIEQLADCDVLVEIGPDATLAGMGRRCLDGKGVQWHPSLLPGQDGARVILESLGALYTRGVRVDWGRFAARRGSWHPVSIPTYPWQRERHWYAAPPPVWESIAAAVRRQAEQGPLDLALETYPARWRCLERLSTAWIAEALSELQGCSDQASLLPAYGGLVERWHRRLAQADGVEASGPLLTQAEALFADAPYLIDYLKRCRRLLVPVLRGEVSALETLFAQGSFDTAEGLYQHWAVARYFNAIVRTAVEAAVQATPSKPWRLIEIGAGTGATCAAVIAVLPPERSRYVFSDLSEWMLRQARDKFAAHDWLEYGVLDIEQSPAAQGYAAGSFDIVLATNVLHATRDLRSSLNSVKQLLAPGGLLVLNEVTRHAPWFDISTALIEGWQRFDDPLRPDQPLLDPESWRAALEACGFTLCEVLPRPDSAAAVLGQHVLLARLTDTASSAPVADMVRGPALRAPAVTLRWTELIEASGDKRRILLIDYLTRQLARVTGATAPLASDRRLNDLGLDSLMAIELRHRIEADLGLSVPLKLLFEEATVAELALRLLDVMPVVSIVAGPENPLDDLESMSEAQIDALLSTLLIEEEMRP